MGLVLLFLVGTNIQIIAQEIHGCVNLKNGNLRIVSGPEECNTKNETHIFWNQTGSQGEPGQPGDPGPIGPQGLPGQGCVNVKSADNEILGTLVDFTGQDNIIPSNVLVFISSLDKFFQFNLQDGTNLYEPLIGRSVNVYFETENCTGTPFIKRNELYIDELNIVYFVVAFKYPGNGSESHFTVQNQTTEIVAQSLKNVSGICDECIGGNCTIGVGNFYLNGVTLPFDYDEGVSLPITFE